MVNGEACRVGCRAVGLLKDAGGYLRKRLLWGSDYPHHESTFPKR